MLTIILTVATFLSWGQIFLENTEPSLDKQVTAKHRLVITKLGYNVKPVHLVPEHKLQMFLEHKTIVLAPCEMRCYRNIYDSRGIVVDRVPKTCGSKYTDHLEVIFIKSKEINNAQLVNKHPSSNV